MTKLLIDRALLEQALEALEKVQRDGDAYWPITIDEAITALRAALAQPNECHWYQDGDEDSGTYMASCSRRYFVLDDGTPKDNRMSHCCYCGKPLVQVLIEPEDNHD
jgi:hypothetical protein